MIVKLSSELRLAQLRSQLATVRALSDFIEHLAPADIDELGEPIIEELARLGLTQWTASASGG